MTNEGAMPAFAGMTGVEGSCGGLAFDRNDDLGRATLRWNLVPGRSTTALAYNAESPRTRTTPCPACASNAIC
jgi:hypothetical protein